MRKKAQYFITKENKKVQCILCPHQCIIDEGDKGICRGRSNIKGSLYTENFSQISSAGVDPIEKKPLYHFFPGSKILSLGSYGCNFSCSFCQNWKISQEKPKLQKLMPEEVINMAQKKDVNSIAFTYSEPLIWYEFVLETSKLAKKNNIKTVLVTNGFINSKPLKKLLPFVDAANVDLKSFRNNFYKNYTDGYLSPVLRNIEEMYGKVHLEVTTLLISDLNTGEKELKDLFSWLADIDSGIPLHLSRYFPNYEMDRPATPLQKMEESYHLASEYLDNVFLGNIRAGDKNNTYCPQCGKLLIKRDIFSATMNLSRRGLCSECGYKIYGEFNL